jgi:FkbM family methyltransferase
MWSRVNKLISKVAAKNGYVISPMWRLRDQELGRQLLSTFNRLDIDCVFDVGANVGQYARFLRSEVGFKGLIVSIEPIAAHVKILRSASASDPLWVVEAVALGAATGRLRINVAKSGDLSSFLKPEKSNETGFAELSGAIAVEEVEVRTFDDLLNSVQKRHLARSVYLKLDTQGFDLEVLRGIRDTTPIRALQSEMSLVPIYESMPDYLTALHAFKDRGFVPSAMFPINHTPDGRLMEFDCVMVRSS